MKKIIIGMMMFVTALSVQASNFKWSAANIYDGTGSTETIAKYTGTAYLFVATTISQADLFAAYAADSTYDYAAQSVANLAVNNGSIAATQVSFGDGGNKYDLYFAIFESDAVYFSSIKSQVTANTTDTPTTLAFGTQNNNSTTFSSLAPAGEGFQGAGHWSAVPEPTSGLLMLVGLAGLALRRKRA